MSDKFQSIIDPVIQTALAQQLTGGVVVIVCRDGKPVYTCAKGYADVENKVEMRMDTLFRFASISKAMTSLGVAALINRGDVALDAPITRYLPNFQPALSDGSVPEITIAQLLSHRAGLGYRWDELSAGGPYGTADVTDGLDITDISLSENVDRIARAPLFFKPGSSWRYSIAPDVLGYMIERVTGQDLFSALNALVLQPLGMTQTVFTVGQSQRAQLAKPYYLSSGKLTLMPEDLMLPSIDDRIFHFSPERVFMADQYMSGGVGLVGTATDLMQVVKAIATDEAPFASKALMHTFSTNQLPAGVEARPGMGFGLGWGVITDPVAADNTPQALGTLAWGGVYGSRWFADRTNHLQAVIMTNTALDDVVSVNIRNAIYQAIA